MKLRKFLARDARSGLEKIRQELGADAVVVTSRKTPEGVEFVAGRYDELPDRPGEQGPFASPAALEDSGVIRRELVKLRALMQNQLAGLAWGMDKRRHPARVHVMQKMMAAGFSPKLSRVLASRLPRQFSDAQADGWLRQVLIRNLATRDKQAMPGVQPGAWALVGPTGHGKTTTLAKLAALAALQHGGEKVALVSIDTYRIGAQQQLSAYAEMMGLDCILLRDAQELSHTLASLADKRCVLIDAAGFGHADHRLSRQLEILAQAQVSCVLTLAASTQGTLSSQIFQRYAALPLAGVALTKLDEGGQWAPVLDCTMRAKLPVVCVASGQRVPEDVHAAQSAYLVDRALRTSGQGEFSMRTEDWPLLAGVEAEADALREAARN
jgi:flagellar biosynthesis protein FlhF